MRAGMDDELAKSEGTNPQEAYDLCQCHYDKGYRLSKRWKERETVLQ